MIKKKKVDIFKLTEEEFKKLMPSLKRKKLDKITDTKKRLYYYQCWYVTESQPLHLLKYHKKRGFRCARCYNLDHIVSISYGYLNNISPEMIGNISNLRFIPYKENIRKGHKLTEDSHKVLRSFSKTKNIYNKKDKK